MGKKKETMITVMKEIESLAAYYEETLRKKEEEIDELSNITNEMQERIIRLETENRSLKVLMDKQKEVAKKILNSTKEVHEQVDLDLGLDKETRAKESPKIVKPMNLAEMLNDITIKEKPTLLMQYLLASLEQKDVEAFEEGLEKALEHIDLFTYKNEAITKDLQSISVRLFINENKFTDVDYDQSFILALNFMTKLEKTPLASVVKAFIQTSFNNLLNNVLHTNHLKIIIPFLRMCYSYKLMDLLKRALLEILQEDWEFIKNDLAEEDMFLIFWYAYLLDIDDVFFDTVSLEQAKQLKSDHAYKIYYYIYDCQEKITAPKKHKYNQYKSAFHQGRGLTEQEKVDVLFKTSNIFNPLLHQEQFTWPSTEIKEEPKKERENEYDLKEKSDLRSFGYQITGLGRTQRWDILKKAVPTLGLSKVAYTIAYNVRLRKGQKNGPITFKHSITEWEHDLAKLKKVYYKNDFRWPDS